MIRYFALSIVAPGGDLIRSGNKTLEIRKWRPDVLPLRDLLIVQNSIWLSGSGLAEDPHGRAVALVDIDSISAWREEDLAAAGGSEWERGCLAWRITNVRLIDCEMQVPAKLRIYEVELPEMAGDGEG